MKTTRLLLLITLLLASCGGETSVDPTQTLIPTPSEPTSLPQAERTPELTPGQPWETVRWEGLVIPLPQDADLATIEPAAQSRHGLPLAGAVAISYPPAADGSVAFYGPAFEIYALEGGVEAWLALEGRPMQPQSVGAPTVSVDQQSVRRTTLGGREATAYRFTNAEADGATIERYAIGLEGDRVLVITTLDLDNETYQRVLDELTVE